MNNLEQEIAELQKMIEVKRDQLEKEGGIVEEKELVRQSVKEMFFAGQTAPVQVAPITAPAAQASVPVNPPSGDGSYLDYLDPQTTEIINGWIDQIPSQGIVPVIEKIVNQEPFVIDAFHDALVDKLYDELKVRGLVK